MVKVLGMIILALLVSACDPAHMREMFGGKPADEAAPPKKQTVRYRVRKHRPRVHAPVPPSVEARAPAVIAPTMPPLVAPMPDPPRPEAPAPAPIPPVVDAPKSAPAKPKPGATRRAWDWFLHH